MAPAGGSERIILGPAVVIGYAPFRVEKSAELEAMESRIERTLFDFEDVIRGPLDPFGDSVSMHRPAQQRSQNEHVQCPLQQFAVLIVVIHHRRQMRPYCRIWMALSINSLG